MQANEIWNSGDGGRENYRESNDKSEEWEKPSSGECFGGGKEISVAVLFNRGKRRSRRLVTGVVE